MKGLQKIKASALQFVMLVSVIIAILLASFLTLTHTHWFFGKQSEFLLESVEVSNDGIIYSLDPNNRLMDSVELKNEAFITQINKEGWGGFLKIESRTTYQSKPFTKIGLTGSMPDKVPTALWMGEKQLPLVLVGDTEIVGDAYVSDRGLKAGIIAGHYYNGPELLQGEIKLSSGDLPKLDSQWLQQTESIIKNFPFEEYILVGVAKENENSFLNATQLIYEKESLTLSETYIGNIIIKSDTEIIVAPFANLKDVVLIAPKVTIQKGFTGTTHLLATKQIKLEENVTMQYPSSVILLENKQEFENNVLEGEEPIILSQESELFGNILYICESVSQNRVNISIDIQNKARVTGHIYCEGNTQLSGVVEGTVFTERFIYSGFGSRYINHIYDGKVLANKLPKEFCGLPLENKKKGVGLWLY